MYYLKNFKTEMEYTHYINGTPLLPNVSLIAEKDIRYNQSKSPVAGEIVYWDGTKIQHITPNNWKMDLGDPIGVVAVPPTHTPDGTTRVMSVFGIDSLGNASEVDITGSIVPDETYQLPQPFYQYAVTWNNIDTYGYDGEGYLPTTAFVDNEFSDPETCILDPIAKYYYPKTYFSSPYLEDGSLNTQYSSVLVPDLEGNKYKNAFGDFNGKLNTNLLYSTFGEDADAAYKVLSYSTSGTNKGDWYLPSIGEFGYVVVRLREIEDAITTVNGAKFDMYTDYYTSTTSSEDSVWAVQPNSQLVYTAYTYDFLNIRPFLSIKL